MMNIIRIDPCIDPRWQQLVERYDSDVFHSPAWIQVVAGTYHFDVTAYVLVDDFGAPVAGIPVCRVKDIRGERLVTMPFSDYHDPLVANCEQWRLLTDQILDVQLPYTIRCLHNTVPLQDERFILKNRTKWHGLSLQPSRETLWQQLDESARRAINKAKRIGIQVRIAEDKNDLRAFFELHLKLRKQKYHLLAQPFGFFENIWRNFIEAESGALLLAFEHGQVIGATLFLEWRNKLYYKFNVSSLTQLSVRPNDLMMWEGIQYGKIHNYCYLDLGLSDWDQEGLIRYKRKFASDEKTISFLHYQPDITVNEQTGAIARLLPQLTNLLTDEAVPNHVTERAGELLYRFFT